MSAHDHRARFRALHARDELFVMPNPWDVGSARLLASEGFEALATTSAGLRVGTRQAGSDRDARRARRARRRARRRNIAAAQRRQRALLPGRSGRRRRDRRAARRGGCRRASRSRTTTRRRAAWTTIDVAARAGRRGGGGSARVRPSRWCSPARAENHIRGVDDLDDTIARLVAYRDAGADVVYAPGLVDLDRIASSRRARSECR